MAKSPISWLVGKAERVKKRARPRSFAPARNSAALAFIRRREKVSKNKRRNVPWPVITREDELSGRRLEDQIA